METQGKKNVKLRLIHLPRAAIHHQSPGRIRFYVPSKVRDQTFFYLVTDQLKHLNNVQKVSVNPLTGSILVVHRGPHSRIIEHAKSEGLFAATPVKSKKTAGNPARGLAEVVFGFTNNLDQMLMEMTDGVLDLQGATSITLFGLAALQAKKGKLLPAGVPLFAQGLSLLNAARHSKP